MPRICCKHFLFWVLAGTGTLAAQTQAPNGQSPQLTPRTPGQREQRYVAQRRIQLHVVVKDASGKPLLGLKPEDFTVLDGNQAQKIAQFSEVQGAAVENDSVHGQVVLDAINGGKGGVNRARKELARLFGHGSGPLAYPLQIVVVSDGGNNEGKATTDRTALIKNLAELTRNVQSTDCDATAPGSDLGSRMGTGFLGQMDSSQARWNCLNSHLTESANALNLLAQEQQNAKGRAIVIWTGPGWPLPPKMDAGQIGGGGGTMGNLWDMIFSLEAAMQEGQVTLEAASWGRFERAQGARRTGLQGSLANGSIPEQEAALELPALAEQTGGLVLERSKDVAEALNTCIGDGEQYYSIAFDPPAAKTQGEYRAIEVKVDRPGATVRTLTGYFTQP